jgi:5-methylthioadenosine/S-adenosylhomocysteine deaminase
MITRYLADHVAPMDGGLPVHSPGFVDVEGGVVAAAGAVPDAPALPAGAVVEQVGGLLLPGFVNTHAHTPMTVLRGAGEGLPLDRWLREAIWPRESRLTPDDVAVGMALGSAEMLRNGVTTTNEMYFFPEAMVEGARRAGIRSVLGAAIIEGLDRFGSPSEQIESALVLSRSLRGDPLVGVALGPHSAYTLQDSVLEQVAEAGVAEDVPVHIHVAETRHEGDGVAERTGSTVPRHLEALGVLDARVIAAHCVWLTDDDIAVLAGAGVGVAHCPGSNGKIASGMAPVRALRSAGIPVGAATDGPASNDDLDVLEEARLALLYARLREHDAAALGFMDALAMITCEAAAALGRDDIGALSPGTWADMVRFDVEHAEYAPLLEPADVLGHLIWAGSRRDVTDVWVAGRRVVEGGRVLTLDVDRARAEAGRVAARIAV